MLVGASSHVHRTLVGWKRCQVPFFGPRYIVTTIMSKCGRVAPQLGVIFIANQPYFLRVFVSPVEPLRVAERLVQIYSQPRGPWDPILHLFLGAAFVTSDWFLDAAAVDNTGRWQRTCADFFPDGSFNTCFGESSMRDCRKFGICVDWRLIGRTSTPNP